MPSDELIEAGAMTQSITHYKLMDDNADVAITSAGTGE